MKCLLYVWVKICLELCTILDKESYQSHANSDTIEQSVDCITVLNEEQMLSELKLSKCCY